MLATLLFALALAQPTAPDLAAQREAMTKLAFLAGTWSGEGTTMRGGRSIRFLQTEQVTYKLDGLVILIEGTGRQPVSGEAIFRALATVSYDDAARVYRFRAYNDGRFIDTEWKVEENGFGWGYQAGPARIAFSMKLNEKGEWVETGEATMPNAPARRFLEMTVRKEK